MPIRSSRPQDAASVEASRLAVAAPASRGPEAGGQAPASSKTRPARLTLGIPGLATQTLSLGPKRAQLADPPAGGHATPSGQEMSARGHANALRRHNRAMDGLAKVAHPNGQLPTAPQTLSAMGTNEGFMQATRDMFGATRGGGLAIRIQGLVPPQGEGETAYIAPLVLATALRSAGAATADEACELLDSVQRGEASPQAFRLERMLAATTPGTHALGQLQARRIQEPAQLGVIRDGLNLCSELERKGVPLDQHGSVQEVLQALEARPELNLGAAIGGDHDAPLALLGKALRYSQGQRADVPAASQNVPSDRAAFAAWKQGGFVESGKGSDFNLAIGRMQKFMTYVDRADHGPRTLKALASDAVGYFGRALGVGKSPLSPMRQGTLGADLGLDHQEAARIRDRLNQSLAAATENLKDELRDPQIRNVEAERTPRLARAAVFELWRETGQRVHTLEQVTQAAAVLLAETGPSSTPLNEAALAKSLRAFTRKAKADDGSPAVKIGMRTLESMGVSRRRGAADEAVTAADATPAGRRQRITELLAEIHDIERGTDRKPLFKFSDLKGILRGTPREGPSPDDAQRVMRSLATAAYDSQSTYADGASKGAGTFGALPLRVGAALGLPLVYPVLQGEGSKHAAVALGNGPTGGRLFIGTERSHTGAVGAGAGWAAPAMFNNLVSAAALAEVSASAGVSHAEGVVISSRSDRPGWQEKLPQVVDFLFDQARQQPAAGRAAEPSELWNRFVDRFGEDPHLSVAWIKDESASVGARVGAVAVGRVASGETNVGPAISGGLSVTGSRFQRHANADGVDVPAAVRDRQVGANVSVGVSATMPSVAFPSDGPVGGWGAAAPLVGASLEWDLGGSIGVARLGRTREGQLSADMCQREILFRDPKVMIQYLNRNRDVWEAALVSKDESCQTTPTEARTRFNAFIQQLADRDSPLNLHGENMTLAPAVVARINAYEARMAAMLGHGDQAAGTRALSQAERAECNAMQNEVRHLLKREENWVPNALYLVEQNAVASTTGLNFGLRVANQERAQTQHLNALLVAGAPDF